MRTFRTILVLLLAAAWLPITSHCKLEFLPGLEFLRCAETSSHGASEDAPCQEKACCTFEFAKYPTSRQDEGTADASPDAVQWHSPLPPDSPPSDLVTEMLADPPPEIVFTWRFQTRAVLDARAPSAA